MPALVSSLTLLCHIYNMDEILRNKPMERSHERQIFKESIYLMI